MEGEGESWRVGVVGHLVLRPSGHRGLGEFREVENPEGYSKTPPVPQTSARRKDGPICTML